MIDEKNMLFILKGSEKLKGFELENIQLQILQILQKQLNRYTSGENSSVPVEIAQKVMKFIIYTIKIEMHEFSWEKKINLLKKEPLQKIYEKGKKKIKEFIEFGKGLLNKLQENKIEIQHQTYCDTVKELPEFFKKYDYNFAAQDTPVVIDYYLSLQEEGTNGIEYICNYMKKLFLENEFCKNFEVSKIDFLLRGYDEEYEQSLINILECVLINSIGCVLCNKSIFNLNITDLERDFLKNKLKDISKYEWDDLLYEAIENLL